jgi:predicted AlkP superfamily phosphohydrolase/phosphomutase/tetratricopeptide (TPR) repeat protein
VKRLAISLGLAGLAVFWLGCPGGGGGRASPRVLLIGIDGADLQIIDRLIVEGKLPTFQRLEREGAFGPLRSQEPLLSPIVWTTIATGRRPEDHGVLDFVEIGADGRPTPITSARRRVPALWNIASEFGKTSGFVGWYASYPAERVKGFEVSDRLAFHQVRSARATAGATYPERLVEDLRKEFGEPAPDLAAVKARFVASPEAALTPDGSRRLGELAKIFATSEYYRKIVPALQRKYRPDLLAVYFEGIDACGHLFMEDAPPKRPEVSDADFQAFRNTVDHYYEYQDEVLADLLRLEGPDTVTLIVSDHGFKTGEIRPMISGRADTGLAPLWHRLSGVVFVHGQPARAGGRIAQATIYDVAPTVLALLQVPVARDLAGHPLLDAFSPGTIVAEKRIDRYEPLSPRPTPQAVAGDSEAIAKLAALGYLSGAGKTMAHDADGRTVSSFINEGLVRTHSRDWEGALRAYGTASRLDPSNVNALAPAAAIYIRRRDYGKAAELLDRASLADPNHFWVHLQRASLDLQTGLLSAAAQELVAAEKIDERLPGLHLLKARVENARGQPSRALEELDRAWSLTDSDEIRGEILLFRAEIETGLGRYSEAEAALERAGRFAPVGELAGARGELAFARHDGAAAERAFRAAVDSDPGSSPFERRLGETLGALERYPESEAALRRAIAKAKTKEEKESSYGDLSLLYQRQGSEPQTLAVLRQGVTAAPDSNLLWGMLGAAFGRAGELDAATEAYEKSISLKPTALACKTLAALVFERRKDPARAVALWRQSLALDPNQPDVTAFLRRYAR